MLCELFVFSYLFVFSVIHKLPPDLSNLQLIIPSEGADLAVPWFGVGDQLEEVNAALGDLEAIYQAVFEPIHFEIAGGAKVSFLDVVEFVAARLIGEADDHSAVSFAFACRDSEMWDMLL